MFLDAKDLHHGLLGYLSLTNLVSRDLQGNQLELSGGSANRAGRFDCDHV